MNVLRFFTGALVCLVMLSCGGSGKDRLREPSRKSKRTNVEVNKSRNTGENERNNGNYRKPTQSRRSKPVERPESETPKSAVPNEARIEQRVRLEQKIWEASEKNSGEFDRLREEVAELTKKMSQEEIDEAARRIKNLKKKM